MKTAINLGDPPSDSDPDPEVTSIAAARRGDREDRWRVLTDCRDYLRLVVRHGRWSRCPGGARTSDLTQKTIVDALQKFSHFHGRDGHQLRGWLKVILINAALRDRREARRIEPAAGSKLRKLRDPAPDPEETAEEAERRRRVRNALATLDARDQAVIRLRVHEGLSFPEVGRRLDVSADAARMRFARAIDRLRRRMRADDDIR